MASTWWIVATGNVNSSTPFASSSGGSGGAGTPTTGDTIIGDAASNNAVLTINAAISLVAFDMQGGGTTGNFNGTILHNAFTITISASGAAAFRLNSTMTYTPSAVTSIVAFTNTSGTANLTTAGKSFGAITMNGAGGTCQQQDDCSVNGATNAPFTLTAGTWDCNGHAFTTVEFSSNNSNVRSFLAGTTITLGGNISTNQTVWNTSTATSFTFTKNSSSITVLQPSGAVAGCYITGMQSTLNLPSLTFNASTNPTLIAFTVGCTLTSMTVGSNWSVCIPQAGATVTIPTVAFNGVAGANCALFCDATSANIQMTCSTSFTAAYTAIGFVAVLGSPPTSVANNCFQFGQISGITFTNPLVSSGTIATALWQDLLSSSDFTTAGSVGALMKAVSNLQYTVQSIGRGTVAGGGSTTSIPTSAFAPAGTVARQFIGRVVLFDWDTVTAALQGQVGVITASTGAATPTFTVTGGGASTTLTTAPASGDTFSVL